MHGLRAACGLKLAVATAGLLQIGCGSPAQTVRPAAVIADSSTSVLPAKDTVSTNAGEVQFLTLSESGPTDTTAAALLTEETLALARVKALYARALQAWFVDQDAEAAKAEYERTVDALAELAEILSREDFDLSTEAGNGVDLMVPMDDTRADVDEGVFLQPTSRLDSLNWLATGIVEHYKALLELRNEFNENLFAAQVINRLIYFDIGLSGLNSYGKIQAPVAKGHALDYIPLNVQNERIDKYVGYLTSRNGAWIQHLYEKFGRYEAIIRDAIWREGLPEELIYVPLIESGFSPTAKSRARAVGFWQFGTGTARSYGLNVDWWVDERRDIHASTQAALRHLKDLFVEYGDWYLALAAYNAGGGRVNRAIRKNNTRDYWEMTKLPRETRNYVPYFIASALIARNPNQYRLQLTTDSAWTVDTVTVTECLDLQVIADCVSSSVDSIRDLNPALLRWCTPPTAARYLLKIPSGTRDRFLANYAKIPQEKKRSWVRYQVKYGENLTLIANKFGTDMKAIMQANQLKSTSNLVTGQYLLIPVAPAGYTPRKTDEDRPRAGGTARKSSSGSGGTDSGSSSAASVKKDEKAGKKKILYKVEAGNTLGEIAEWYNIIAQQIRDWNGLYYGDPIYPGQTLTLWVDSYVPDEGYRLATQKKAKQTAREEPGMKVYEVQEGDTLASIAKLFGVEVSSIKRWNKLSSNIVRAGDRLKIYVK